MKKIKVAYFITPHGFGHASRACAVMNAVNKTLPNVAFEIFTEVPIELFQESLGSFFSYNSLLTDIGLVQKSPFEEDIPQTIEKLNNFLPFSDSLIENVSQKIKDCNLVICDVCAMGIVVAKKNNIPSILIENFTWDWIYEGYVKKYPEFAPFIKYLKDIYRGADSHIQTEPVCDSVPSSVKTLPVSRKPRVSVSNIRSSLNIPIGKKMVLITMGGIKTEYNFIQQLTKETDIHFVIPGGYNSIKTDGNVTFLPFHSRFYHPDLINASDGVIGKNGYSTVAEVYASNVPLGYVSREDFRESKQIEKFIEKNMNSFSISMDNFEKCLWMDDLRHVMSKKKRNEKRENGSYKIAELICRLLN